MDLENLEKCFLKSLLNPKDSSQMLQSIRPQSQIHKLDRLKIYQESYRNRIISRLQKKYFIFTQFIGKTKSMSIFSDYLNQNPSNQFSLSEIGCSFPQYIKKTQITTSKTQSMLSDLVKLEWLLHSSFYREYDPFRQNPTTYPNISLDEASKTQVCLLPSVQILWSHWPIVKIYQEEKEQDPCESGAITWSIKGQVKLKSINRFTFQLIEGMQKWEELQTTINSIDIPEKQIAISIEKAFADLASNKIIKIMTT